jgi:aspartate dehydrogenase
VSTLSGNQTQPCDADGTVDAQRAHRPLKVGLIGFGAVGQDVGERLLRGDVPGVTLVGIAVVDRFKTQARLQAMGADVAVMDIATLVATADIVCECASVDGMPAIVDAVLRAGKTLIAISVTALPRCGNIAELTQRYGGQLRIAGGGLAGLDIIRTVCEDHVDSIHLTTTFRPQSLAHDPYTVGQGFDFTTPPLGPVKVFEGTVRAAAEAFPRHFNVAFALSLGGIGQDRTQVSVWVDPAVEGTVQAVEVRADAADLTLVSRTRPSRAYRSSRIVAPSVVAALRSYVSPIHVGS